MQPLPAFAGYGIELEYAIVDRETLDVRPLAGALLETLAGAPVATVTRGDLGWSNELVSHVVEIKNNAPSARLDALPLAFADEVRAADALLAAHGARLMPTGMHPWMDPRGETVLWRGEAAAIYAAFDRIFDCRRHGWANLQSMHVNLPFADDREFALLHAAVRAVLPLVPAIAASSPVADGAPQAELDHRLEVYRTNATRVPSVTGAVIPPEVASRDDYESRVLRPMYRDVAPLDPRGELQHEWLNARGAIARFDRHAIEIRLCDTQECPRADLAIAAAVIAVVRCLYEERWQRASLVRALPDDMLVRQLRACIARGDQAIVDDGAYLAVLGLRHPPRSAGEVWAHLIEACGERIRAIHGGAAGPLAAIVSHGTLARRILRALEGRFERQRLREAYARLCDCLESNEMFEG
jgi:gamma-glutamyl:cysteine ligase YbdK (ATP-grasp superfamily)